MDFLTEILSKGLGQFKSGVLYSFFAKSKT